jgi:hypothetical protein
MRWAKRAFAAAFLVETRAGLLGHLDVADWLDLPVGQERAELAELALVPRREDRCYRGHSGAVAGYSSQRTAKDFVELGQVLDHFAAGDRGREDDLEAELPALIAGLLELDPLDLRAPRLEDRQHGSERLVGTQVDLETAGRPAPSDDVALRPAERPETEEHDPCPQ